MNGFMKKWGLIIKVLIIVSILLVIKIVIIRFDLDVESASPLITALVGGVIFTIAIIFTGTLTDFSEKNVPPQFLVKLRSELTSIDRFANRIQTIIETSFIPAAYAIAELAVFAVLLVLLFVKTEAFYEGLALIGATSSLLIGLIMLIKDMDNPFEVGRNSYADVDLSILFELGKYLD